KDLAYYQINNDKKAIEKFFNSYSDQQVIVAMENTGRYNWSLYDAIADFHFKVYVLNPIHFSKSQGLARGKDDKTDSYRIALFVEKYADELPIWKPVTNTIKELKILLTERNARIKSKKRLLKQSHDYKKMKDLNFHKELKSWNKQQIKQLDNQIAKIEVLIEKIIQIDTQLNKYYKLIQSIPGVGKITSWYMLAKTEGFTKISCPRKMACYSGVVPFKHQSGSSIFKKPKVSIYADKQMKSILHLAAMSAIRLKNDLQIYYKRKVEEGKNKMSVLNAVRNKIIHLIFAIIKSNKKFENRLVSS
ncbi:IS110 family transposase, partial [uncultured Aquimarina sp.]|uniref:IS110 family transposase n=1 Tax=uncultured Aquimarina sp. TaxID=575652 RepID=UPI0026100DF9